MKSYMRVVEILYALLCLGILVCLTFEIWCGNHSIICKHVLVVMSLYKGVSKSFQTESITKYTLTLVLLIEKQHNGLWQQNSLD
jgi:hypothetical protein